MAIMTATLRIVLLAVTVSAPLAAQTLSEQLQRAIYAEQTLGDHAEAARLYRQILAAPAVPRAIAEEATRRLRQLTTAIERQPRGTPATPATHASVAPLSIAATLGSDPPRGTVVNGHYRHLSSDIEFDGPNGWVASDTYPSSDGGDGVTFVDPNSGRSINVWMIKENTPEANVEARVAGAPAEKVRQRHSGYSIPGMRDERTYHIPPQTVQQTMINGRHAIVAIGSYRGVPADPIGHSLSAQWRFVVPPPAKSGEQAMHEYMTWVYTARARAFFYARVPVDDLSIIRAEVDRVVMSVVMP
jgi:hypothetical protein